jgi:DNA-binding MarR family transcriptional regulator
VARPQPLDGDDLQLWRALIRLSQLLPRTLEAELAERDESLPVYELLAVLAAHPAGLRMSELAEIALVSKPRATVHVQALEAEGLLARTPDPADGRATLVQLTAAGRGRLRRLAPGQLRIARDQVIDQIPEHDRATVLAALADVLTALGDPWRPST